MRAAPLPGARVAVVVFLKVAHGPMAFWIGVPPPLRRRPPPSRHVPWLSGCGWRRAEKWPRPRPVPPPERLRRGWVTEPARPRSRRSHQLGRVTRPGAGCEPPGGPNQGRVGGARKAESETRSKREAWRLHLLLEFLLPLQFRSHDPGAARCLRSVASVERPYSGRVRWATRGPPASAAAHSGRQGESVPHSGSQPGVSTPLRVTARECQS